MLDTTRSFSAFNKDKLYLSFTDTLFNRTTAQPYGFFYCFFLKCMGETGNFIPLNGTISLKEICCSIFWHSKDGLPEFVVVIHNHRVSK